MNMELSMPRRRVFAAYLEEARSEVLRYLRNPGFLLPIILLLLPPAIIFSTWRSRSVRSSWLALGGVRNAWASTRLSAGLITSAPCKASRNWAISFSGSMSLSR